MHLWKRCLPAALGLLLGAALAVKAAPESPDGKLQALIDRDTIKLVDKATGKEVRAMKGHVGAVTAVAFTPDGKALLSGGNDKTVLSWDLASGKLLWKVTAKAAIANLTVSPDGKTVTAVDADKAELKLDAATGKLLP
jgi:WD40 repeat protein